GRNVGDDVISLCVRDGEIRGFGNDDPRGHLRMDVAKQSDDSWFAENLCAGRLDRISAKIERHRRPWRKDIMAHNVAVWKNDSRSDTNHHHVWLKLEIDLIQGFRLCRRRKCFAWDLIDIDNGLAIIGRPCDGHLASNTRGIPRQKQRRCNTGESEEFCEM